MVEKSSNTTNRTLQIGVAIFAAALFALLFMGVAGEADQELVETTDTIVDVNTDSEWLNVVDEQNSENYLIENDRLIVGVES